jgi:hypothetical protein
MAANSILLRRFEVGPAMHMLEVAGGPEVADQP